MAIPKYESVMLPLLRYAGDGETRLFKDVVQVMAHHFEVSEDEQKKLLPSGGSLLFPSRVGWARTYLTKAGLLEAPARGQMRITQRGKEALAQNPTQIDNAFLNQYSEFREFQAPSKSKIKFPLAQIEIPELTSMPPAPVVISSETPDERLESAFSDIYNSLAQDLLAQVKTCSPGFFERLVVDLLVAMGYGGSIEDAAEVVGKSGDGGIDGIIKEDRLGLDAIYVQAKKWEDKSPVSRPDVQGFVGALSGHHASKGVFITTGRFSVPARDFVKNLNYKVVLIDGEQLARYMIDFNIGVSLRQSYQVKKIDSDYFSEE